ncbi:MAG: glycosyltransferase [Patescibacteria group bacterium]|nr:glycosyltransferase [Patescibacteria group bacterium]
MSCFFSIIIPVLNEEKYLPRLLNDLLQQKEKDFEVIVVDGGSEDRTVKLANDYRTKLKVLKIVSTKIRSAAYQRNLGAEKANGKYLVFFDADLKVSSDYLKNLKSYLSVDNVSFATTHVKTDQRGFFAGVTVFVANFILDKAWLLGKQMAYGFNIIIDKKAFSIVGGFDSGINVTDDYDFSLRAKEKGYKLNVYKNLFVTFSLRRFQKMGWLNSFIFYLKIIFHNLFKGPSKEKVFVYPMGGKAHE